MIERLDKNNRWVKTGWISYNQLRNAYNTISDTWKDDVYIYIATSSARLVVLEDNEINIYRQPYLKVRK